MYRQLNLWTILVKDGIINEGFNDVNGFFGFKELTCFS